MGGVVEVIVRDNRSSILGPSWSIKTSTQTDGTSLTWETSPSARKTSSQTPTGTERDFLQSKRNESSTRVMVAWVDRLLGGDRLDGTQSIYRRARRHLDGHRLSSAWTSRILVALGRCATRIRHQIRPPQTASSENGELVVFRCSAGTDLRRSMTWACCSVGDGVADVRRVLALSAIGWLAQGRAKPSWRCTPRIAD
ncbi:hypothetical protein T492DRAFT_841740 [Pavlovales sp. CCMP2436]|nr:hypothetical protein T492DRAFT_841740 [Pavlovales sp. CCMP2436]